MFSIAEIQTMKIFGFIFTIIYMVVFFLVLIEIKSKENDATKEEIINSLIWPWLLIVMFFKLSIELLNEYVIYIPFTLFGKKYKDTKVYNKLYEFSKDRSD